MPRPLKATIDLAAIRHNVARARACAPRSALLAVVKANAYGHGVTRVVRALSGADGVALLEMDAAVRLRDSGYTRRIALLQGAFDAGELQVAAQLDLTIVIHNQEQLRLLDAAPAGAQLDVLLKINTGMNRLGFAPGMVPAILEQLRQHAAVARVTLMAHFAAADEARGVAAQMTVFNAIAGSKELPCTLANSAAILRYPETHRDWVRPGIMLYGCSPFADIPAAQLDLRPVMTLTSEIIAVQDLRPGDEVGYGGAFQALRAMRIGMVACGYADGYPRHAPTGTPVLVAGHRSRTLGRVAMDMLCVDLSELQQAHVGTSVTLWGAGLSADEVAASAGTISYELLSALARRVPVAEVG